MHQNTFEINSCEVCNNKKLIPVLNLGMHPLCDDLVSIGDSRICDEYPIEIIFCEKCLTAHQRYQVYKNNLFPKTYHYRSRFTADVLGGMSNLVESILNRFGKIDGKKILDIGCNDGSLLDVFAKKGAVTIGIEPTGAANDVNSIHNVYKEYFSEEVALKILKIHGNPDIITFTNVFAHIENLQQILDSLKLLIDERTIIIIENHYLGSILKSNQFDTFYHEHPRSYSYTSFTYMANSLGLKIICAEFPSRYGGNIRMFLGNTYGESFYFDENNLNVRESLFFEEFSEMDKNLEYWKRNKKRTINDLIKKHGKLRAKAFPGRAAILIKLLGLNENNISAVYEKPGSMKIGNYVPGTKIPIYSDKELFKLDNDNTPILNLAWHIPDEIKLYMKDHGINSTIENILSLDDFIGGN